MADKLYLIFPLIAAVLYALSALSVKTSTSRGVEALHTTLIANIITALAFLIFVDWNARPFLPDPLWPVLLLGVLFCLGQITTFLSLSTGAVSIATPILSTKVVMVAFILSFLYGKSVETQIWFAGFITVLGVSVLQLTDRSGTRGKRAGLTAILALLAALFYGLFDVMAEVYSEEFGFGRFVPFGIAFATLLSLGLMPFCKTSLKASIRASGAYLWIGTGLMALQALVLITAIGKYNDAAGCNIVYGSRAVWSIGVVWLLGKWFENAELKGGRNVLIGRLAGAALIIAGIILVFL